MIYAQFKSGHKLHLICEAGEEYHGQIIRKGFLSFPLCGRTSDKPYRMTIGVPLGNACKNCCRIYDAMERKGQL
jgi:hypothetical protein